MMENSKNSMKHNMNIAFKFIRMIHKISKSYIPISVISILLSSAITLVNVIFPKFIIDELLGSQNIDRIIIFVAAIIGINFSFNLLIQIINFNIDVKNEEISAKLDIILGEKSLELDFEQIEQGENLELKERAMFIIKNQNPLNRLVGSIRTIVENVITIIGLVAIIATLDIIVILFIVAVLFVSFQVIKKQNIANYVYNQEFIPVNRIYNYYNDLISDFSSGKDIRIYNVQPLILSKFDEFIDKNLGSLTKLSRKQTKYQNLGAINMHIEYLFIYAYLCYKVFINSISIGDFTMYINAINGFNGAIQALISQFFEFSNMCQYLNPFFEFLDLQPKYKNGKRQLEIDPNNYELVFEHVSFSYPNTNTMALNDVCVSIRPNEKISIVGLNGAGKTTFVKLLTRLYRPTSGVVLLNGIDINEYKYEEYIKFFSAIFQDFKNYSFTIKENISLSESNYVEDEVVLKILEELSMDEKILSLENGINTSLYKIFDNDGIEFSGGEMQKIAIARVSYKDACFMILDEPTSALDPVMEYEIMNNFNTLVRNKTAIYISHRLSSCKFTDRILVFEDGEIVEQGTHSELMKQDGLYYEMFSSQSQYYV